MIHAQAVEIACAIFPVSYAANDCLSAVSITIHNLFMDTTVTNLAENDKIIP